MKLYETDDFGHTWLKDLIWLWPRRWWYGRKYDRPRIHLCAFWGECKSYGAAPNISLMGWSHCFMLYVPSSRNTRKFHFRHHVNSRLNE